MHLAQAMTALQNKNTMGAACASDINQSLTTLSTGAGGVGTSGGIPAPTPIPSPSASSSGPGAGSPAGGSKTSFSCGAENICTATRCLR
jgi:hypothetical protein